MTLRLYVVGESSGDPETWSVWSELALVLAPSPERAVELAGRTGPVAAVELREGVLMTIGEPSWGDDT